jgi:ribA/ribD-fused uncharacterized protein
MKAVNKILEFQGPYRFLSNFYPAPMVWDGIPFLASENAYVAAKTTDLALRMEISRIKKPGEVKRFGRKITVRPDWDEVKIELMKEIVMTKFIQNPDLMKRLLDTGDAILEEGNNWRDTVWGICPVGSGNGRNELGKILMRLRDEFRKNTVQ